MVSRGVPVGRQYSSGSWGSRGSRAVSVGKSYSTGSRAELRGTQRRTCSPGLRRGRSTQGTHASECTPAVHCSPRGRSHLSPEDACTSPRGQKPENRKPWEAPPRKPFDGAVARREASHFNKLLAELASMYQHLEAENAYLREHDNSAECESNNRSAVALPRVCVNGVDTELLLFEETTASSTCIDKGDDVLCDRTPPARDASNQVSQFMFNQLEQGVMVPHSSPSRQCMEPEVEVPPAPPHVLAGVVLEEVDAQTDTYAMPTGFVLKGQDLGDIDEHSDGQDREVKFVIDRTNSDMTAASYNFESHHSPRSDVQAGVAPLRDRRLSVCGAAHRGHVVMPAEHALDPAVEPESVHKHGVFANVEELKESLRRAIGKPMYNVTDYYKTTGIWQAIGRHPYFESITLSVIGFNALWLAVDADGNTAEVLLDAPPIYQIADNFFCLFFTLEWVVRYMAFERKLDGCKDSWFVFDGILMLLMVLDTWVLMFMLYLYGGQGNSDISKVTAFKILRLVRLIRTARMARLLKALPELMIMIKGMAVAMRSIFFTLCLLMCVVYVFALTFVQLMGPKGALQPLSHKWDPTLFSDVPTAMNTLLLAGALPDEAPLINQIGREAWIMRGVILLYVLLAGLTVMNMLVGVLCEVVSVVSAIEKEGLMVSHVKTVISDMLKTSGLDANGDNQISREEFESLLEKPAAARALHDVGVDVVGLVDFTDFIFQEEDTELSFTEFMDVVLQLRGCNTAKVKDIVDLRKMMVGEIARVSEDLRTELANVIKVNRYSGPTRRGE